MCSGAPESPFKESGCRARQNAWCNYVGMQRLQDHLEREKLQSPAKQPAEFSHKRDYEKGQQKSYPADLSPDWKRISK